MSHCPLSTPAMCLRPLRRRWRVGSSPTALEPRSTRQSLVSAPFRLAARTGEVVNAEVIDADRFGSLRLSVPADSMAELGLDGGRIEIALGHHVFNVPVGSTFSDVARGEPVALVDSSGWLTIAVNTDSAQERYGVEPGTPAHLRALT